MRGFWGALFLVLLLYSGGLHASWLSEPKMTNQIITLGILALCLVLPARRAPHVPRLIAQMWRQGEALPPVVWLCAVLWLACVAWSTSHSSVPRLSLEYGGFLAWNLLLCALVYGYAARGPGSCQHVMSGVIIALDVAIVRATGHYVLLWTNPSHDALMTSPSVTVTSLFGDPAYLGHYLALLLPLALWDASGAYGLLRGYAERQATNSGIDVRRPAAALWACWRTLRPAVMLGLGVAVAPAAFGLAVVGGLCLYFSLLRRLQRASTPPSQPARAAWVALVRPYVVPLGVGFLLATAALAYSAAQGEQGQHFGRAHQLFDARHSAIYENVTDMVRQRPLTGWGPGTFAVNYPQFRQKEQVREPLRETHNIYLHRLVEEGALALLFWLALVLVIGGSGLHALLWRSPRPAQLKAGDFKAEDKTASEAGDELLVALCCALLMSGISGLFVMPEALPTISVHFYAVLALIAALRWGAAAPETASPISTAARPYPLSRWVMTGVVAVALSGVAFYAPWVYNTDRAHWLFDRSMASTSLKRRVDLLRQATFLDPDQPIYWAQLGLARYRLEGPSTARSVANHYRAALQRAPSDGLHWHNLAMLYLAVGDYTNAIRNETRAVQYDPATPLYQHWLAAAYARTGNFHKAVAHRGLAQELSRPQDSDETAGSGYGITQPDGAYRRLTTKRDYSDVLVTDLPNPMIDLTTHRKSRKLRIRAQP